jgi:hypothetical protein
MNIVIKNTGTVPVNLYNILPGNIDTPLILCNYDHYKEKIVNYQRVPIFINNIVNAQTLGQWIYFREFNIYTNQSIFYNNDTQVSIDRNALLNIYNKENPSTDILEIDSTLDIIGQDNIQLGMLNKTYISNLEKGLGFITIKDNDIVVSSPKIINNNNKLSTDINDYFYKENSQKNKVVYMYENINGILNNTKIYLDNKTSISQFINSGLTNLGDFTTINSFDGAFLFVNLENKSQILTKGSERDNYEIPVGESVSIPITFEYFLSEKKSISKRIMFDIRNSLLTNPLNYILELTANYDTSLNVNMYNTNDESNMSNVLLKDEANKE